jgi:integration host factor subunit beta
VALAGVEGGMTRIELIKRLARKTRMTRVQATVLVETIFDGLAQSLRRGEPVEIAGFGTFDVRRYRPHLARNPRTGEPVEVKARRLAFFRASSELAGHFNQEWEPAVRLVHRGPGKPKKSTGITGVWQAFEPEEAPMTDEITRKMG